MLFKGMYKGEPIFNDDLDRFGGPRHEPLDPRKLEEIKAKALIKRSDAENVSHLVSEIEAGYYHRNMIEEENKRLLEDLRIAQKKLNLFQGKYGEVKRCDRENCHNGIINGYGLANECPKCRGKGYLLPETLQDTIFYSIDVAAEDSKDATCIATFKKHKDRIELMELKTIKPKKK